MHVGVHRNGIVIVAPPSDIAISLVHGTGEPGNGSAAIGIVEALVTRFHAVVSKV
jgi:hypothetical protein